MDAVGKYRTAALLPNPFFTGLRASRWNNGGDPSFIDRETPEHRLPPLRVNAYRHQSAHAL